MAKPLSPKSRLIREALKAHPNMGNTELAETINQSPAGKQDGITVTAMEVASQKQALKKAGSFPAVNGPARKPGRPKGSSTAAPPPVLAGETPMAQASPVDLIDKVFDLAKETGGFAALKRLVDRIAEMEKK